MILVKRKKMRWRGGTCLHVLDDFSKRKRTRGEEEISIYFSIFVKERVKRLKEKMPY